MRQKNVTVSVIIPTLQEEDYIGKTLVNLQRATFPAEVIVVDGGSSDKTVEVARRFTDNVYSVKKRGISCGRNYGAKEAKGTVLLFLDADVSFPSNFVEKTVKVFEDLTVMGATCNIMPSRFRLHTFLFFYLYNAVLRVLTRVKPHSRGEFLAVRRTAFMRVNGFDEDMPCLEDHDLANRVSKLGKFVFISDLTVYESLRRFTKLGFWRVFSTWVIDYLSFMFRGKPISPTWQPVR